MTEPRKSHRESSDRDNCCDSPRKELLLQSAAGSSSDFTELQREKLRQEPVGSVSLRQTKQGTVFFFLDGYFGVVVY